jgi:hypothetical protein
LSDKGGPRVQMKRFGKAWWGAAILLFWLLFAQALGVGRAASITFDEGPHLAVGYATLRTGDFRLQPVHIHPPLANVLAAAPLLLNADLPDPRMISGWEIASLSAVTDAVIWQYPHPARLAFAGRLPIILLTVLTGALVWRWATDLGGEAAGLLALALYALDPNIIAHGSLVTTDMAVTAFGLLAFFLLHRYLRRQGRAHLIGIGVALGLALASKVSAVLLVLMVGAVLAIKGGQRSFGLTVRAKAWRQAVRSWLRAAVIPFGAVGLVAFLILWAVYGFQVRALPDLAGSLPLPAATHLEIYRSLQEHYRLGHPAFLMGQNSEQGWWYYFPVAFLVKTPLPTLVLLGAALIPLLVRRRSIPLTLALYPLVYVITALFSSVDIGYRHLLPILPFAYIMIGDVSRVVLSASVSRFTFHVSRFTLYALILWQAVGTALIYPAPLTFFNELAGGPGGGPRWLVDSNLDWGQNLWQLRDWMRAENVERVYYSHFSPARPQVYGVTADWLPPDPRAVPFASFDPAPGIYAIGATTLQGVYTPDVNTFAYFRDRQVDTVLGHALFVYHVPQHPTPDWAAVCFGTPATEQQIRARFGQPNLRLVFYDCEKSQVYPVAGEGRYLLPPESDGPDERIRVLQARHPDGTPAFNIWEAAERPFPQQQASQVYVEGPLRFLGHDFNWGQVAAGGEAVLRTYWQVSQVPERPLSLMAHLIGSDGIPVAVGDGLGVPVEQWQLGDIIVQRHRLAVPEDTAPGRYRLQTGVYWLDTLKRWSVRLEDGTTSDRLLLNEIIVTE